MIRRGFIAASCFLLSAAAQAETLEFCHQNTLESVYDSHSPYADAPETSFEVGYRCQGNSGVIFTYEGSRWTSSRGDVWEITGEWATPDDAKKICAGMNARLPSEEAFLKLTSEIKDPVSRRIAPFFGLRPDARQYERFWIGDNSTNYMRYTWNPRSGLTNGRYFSDSTYPVVCKR